MGSTTGDKIRKALKKFYASGGKPWNAGKKTGSHKNPNCQCMVCKSKRRELIPWAKGKTRATDERLEKMAKAKEGKPSGMLGKIHPVKGSFRIKRITRLCKCGCNTSFICKEISSKRFVKGHSSRGRIISAEERKRRSYAVRGKPKTAEHIEKVRLANIGKKRSLETRKKVSEAVKRSWKNSDYVSKQMFSRGCKPNKLEMDFLSILNQLFPNEYKFVGDGRLIIGGRCPDFVNVNGQKKLIELYGDYWHRGQDPQERIALFEQYGYETLILWEKEMKYRDQIIQKLMCFHTEDK